MSLSRSNNLSWTGHHKVLTGCWNNKLTTLTRLPLFIQPSLYSCLIHTAFIMHLSGYSLNSHLYSDHEGCFGFQVGEVELL